MDYGTYWGLTQGAGECRSLRASPRTAAIAAAVVESCPGILPRIRRPGIQLMRSGEIFFARKEPGCGVRLPLTGASRLAHAHEAAVVLAGEGPQERADVRALIEEADRVDAHLRLARLQG